MHILQALKSTLKNNDVPPKYCLKRYVFNPFLKPFKDGDWLGNTRTSFLVLRTNNEEM